MTHRKAGMAAVLTLLLAGAGAFAAPQNNPGKPGVTSALDGSVKGISGYNMKEQAPISHDGEFLRRVMIDLVGYPPNLEQVKAFIADPNPKKREVKIDELLASDEWAELWTRKWAEVFFGNYHDVTMDTMPKLAKQSSERIVKGFMEWFQMKLKKDAPWTDIVAQMLEAKGTDEGDPALAYKLSFYKDEGFTVEFSNGVAQHLLGTRMVCARCHDHPFDKWRVEDYYGISAFVVRQRARGYGNGGEKDSVDHVEIKYNDEGEQMMPDIQGSGKKAVNLADGGVAKPIFAFTGQAAGKNDDRQKLFAMFMTSKANTQLPRAMANRVWGWLMGRGVVHPVDDFNLRNKALSAALLDGMTRDLMANKYSMKHLIRAICNTEAYQRDCGSEVEVKKTNFSRATVTLLSAEQLLQSIRVATQGKPVKDINGTLEMVKSLFPAGAVWCETTPLPGNARQALLMRNNTQIMSWISGSVLQSVKGGSGSIEEKIDNMFLAALSRTASDAEKKRYKDFLEKNGGTGWEDAYWTILNSAEFVTRH
jgi:hypothetical protein